MLVYVVDRDGEFDVFEDVADAQRVASAHNTTYQEQATMRSSEEDPGTRAWLDEYFPVNNQ